MEQNDDREEIVEGDERPSGSNKKIYIIIGVVVAVILAVLVPTMLARRSPAEATDPTLTLGSLNASLVSVEGRLIAEETKSAMQAETLANIQQSIGDLSNQISGLTAPTDWQPTIDAVKATVDGLIEQVNGLTDWSGNITALNTTVADLQVALDALSVEVDNIDMVDWSANITVLGDRLDSLETFVADLEATLNSLSVEVDNIVIVDWSANITVLSDRLDSLEASVDALALELDSMTFSFARYAVVSGIGADYLIAEVFGAGYYPVVLTLYGNSLETDDVIVYPPVPGFEITPCSITNTYLSATNSTLAVVVEPDVAWTAEDVIMLQILEGDIHYATANVAEIRE